MASSVVTTSDPRHEDRQHGDDAVVIAKGLMSQVSTNDVASMVCIQRDMLSRFEKTNEMLINFNILSTTRFEETLKDFTSHTQLLYEMKKDLDSVFKRIRILKHRLGKTYPEAFAACSSICTVSDEDSDSNEDRSDVDRFAETKDQSTSMSEFEPQDLPGDSDGVSSSAPTHVLDPHKK